MTPTTAALVPLVDALVAQPLTDVPMPVLQEQIAALTPLVGRLDGWLQAAAAQVLAASDGTVPREDGSAQTVATWLADVQQSMPSAAGRQLRTSTELRGLPMLVARSWTAG